MAVTFIRHFLGTQTVKSRRTFLKPPHYIKVVLILKLFTETNQEDFIEHIEKYADEH